MKKILTIMMLFIASNKLKAQCLNNGITTNPSAPVNSQLPSKTNLYFNWTQPSWQNNSSCEPLNTIESPFYKIDNLEILRASKDMQPQDGWELIRREFGYTDQNTLKPQTPEHTYLVLYNKYTGILRILLKVCRNGADYNGAKITIKFDATTNFQSALLDYSSTPRVLDETHIQNPVAQSASVFVNDKTKWFYADFPMTYDPCTCKYKSKLNIVSQLIQNSQIQLQGSLTGTITTISNGQGSVKNDGSYSFKDFVNDADKFKKGYSSVDNFITETKNVANTIPNSGNLITALTNLQTGLKDNLFLKTGLAAVPWLKTAAGLLDFFSGGGKTSPQTVQLMPMAVNLSLKVNGTMTTANQYHDIKFSNPGTLNAQNDPDIYPFYNEILGVFNLMNGPIFTTNLFYSPTQQLGIGIQSWGFKLKQPIKWVLNPSSDLQLQDGQIAYVVQSLNNSTTPPSALTFPGPSSQTSQGFNTLEGKDATSGLWEYRTEYVNLNCLGNDHRFVFQRTIPFQAQGSPMVGKFYIKLILNFKRISTPTSQNVLLILKIPIRQEMSQSPVTGYLFDATICPGGMVSQATTTEINTFCASTTYTTNRLMRNIPVDTTGILSVKQNIKVSPNPAQNMISFSGKAIDNKINKIEIIDMLGKIQAKYSEQLSGSFSKTYDVSNLSNGTYILKASYADGKSNSLKLIISK